MARLALGCTLFVAYALLCFFLFSRAGEYLNTQRYNSRVVSSNSTCEGCVSVSYYVSRLDHQGNCELYSFEACSRGSYLAFLSKFKCNDSNKYNTLADPGNLGSAFERCSFEAEPSVYHSREEYRARTAAYRSFPWLDYIAICTTISFLLALPLVTRRVAQRDQEQEQI